VIAVVVILVTAIAVVVIIVTAVVVIVVIAVVTIVVIAVVLMVVSAAIVIVVIYVVVIVVVVLVVVVVVVVVAVAVVVAATIQLVVMLTELATYFSDDTRQHGIATPEVVRQSGKQRLNLFSCNLKVTSQQNLMTSDNSILQVMSYDSLDIITDYKLGNSQCSPQEPTYSGNYNFI